MTSTDKVEFTFGDTGVPADLAVLGLRTGIYINDAASEDLAVFVTGNGNAEIAAGFTVPTPSTETKTEPPFSVTFNSATQYSITDTATNTVVATRDYTANSTIRFNGLTLSFDSPPEGGDQFIIDGNAGGIGDNGNMLLLAGLETKPTLANGQSISDGYIDIVSGLVYLDYFRARQRLSVLAFLFLAFSLDQIFNCQGLVNCRHKKKNHLAVCFQ